MKKLPSLELQDIVRVIRPSVSETEQALRDHWSSVAPFNYELVRRLSIALSKGDVPLSQVEAACARLRNKAARKPNADVARLLWRHLYGRSLFVHHLDKRLFPLRRDLGIWVKPIFYYVENGRVVIFWLQPRKTYALTDEQLGVLSSVIRRTFIVDDFEAADIEILDLSAPAGANDRATRVFSLESFKSISDEDLLSAFSRFAAAYDQVRASGFEPARRQPPREAEDDSDDLFPAE